MPFEDKPTMLKKDLRQMYLRKRNTFNFSVDNLVGVEGKDEVGNFNIRLPPFTFPEHQSSQYALFKLDSVYITRQGKTQATRVSQNVDTDISGFYVEINGLGIRSVIATVPGIVPINNGVSFFILNETALTDLQQSFQYSMNSGGKYDGESVVCSNPSGTVFNIKIRSADDGNVIADSEDYMSVVNFSIELLDLD